MSHSELFGSGLGLRRGLMAALHDHLDQQTSPDIMPIDFMEVAPENWIGVGGRFGKQFRSFTERFPFACHGLSLSIGGTTPIDIEFVKSVKNFLDTHGIEIYSEHLSFCSDHGHLYDLMPIPFTEDSVKYVAERIMQVQDILGRRLIIENVSAYLEPGKMMSEPDFVRAVVELSDCDLLLDVNNVYVNSVNHGYTPKDYIDLMPTERIRYYHVAGHYVEKDNLLIDTHGAPVIDPVWDLLNHAYDRHGVKATLLERDFNYSDLDQLGDELHTIKKIQNHQLSAKSDLIGIKDYG